MEASLREQTHQLIDELSQQQLLSLRMFLDDVLRTSPERPATSENAGPPPPFKRISINQYRRAMGLAVPA